MKFKHQSVGSEGHVEPTAAGEAPPPASPALKSLPGEHRKLVEQFARDYYQANTKRDRNKIDADYHVKSQYLTGDGCGAMINIIGFVCRRDLDGLLKYIERDEYWLKSNG